MVKRDSQESDPLRPSSKSGPSFLRKQGPFLVVGVTAIVVAGAVAFAFVTSGEEVILDAVTTTSPETSSAPTSSIDYPLSYSQAVTAGTADTIDWGERCDTSTGRLAVPDFFAPECMAPFVGDNGGVTSPGVSVETIKIVHYQPADNEPVRYHIDGAALINDTNEQQSLALVDFLRYFGEYYEFYGRSVELVTFQSLASAADDAAARADAQRIAEQFQPFAVIGGPLLTNAFADELAGRKIVCIDCGTGSTQWFKDRNPFIWSTDASGTQKQIHLAEMIQKQLVGKPAEFGGADLKTKPRVFGHLYLDRGPESGLLAEQLITRLEAAGAPLAVTIPYTLEPEKMKEKATEIITKLKEAGVTTVILSTDPATPRELTREAFVQKYNPEWLVAAAPLVETSTYGRAYVVNQWARAFGVSSQAIRAGAPAGNYFSLYEWYVGRGPYADETVEWFMRPFAFLMSAIQSTGPNLNPESFAATIRTLATKQAVTQPFFRWGDNAIWEDGDFSGIEDATLFWWDPEASGTDERRRAGNGLMRFAEGGKRYMPGEWPTEAKLFVEAGSATVLEAVPPGEEVKTYPSPVGADTTTTTIGGVPPATEPEDMSTSSTSSTVPAG